MKKILKKMFGSKERPIFPLGILISTFAVAIVLSLMSTMEVAKISSFIGLGVFAIVSIYNLVLILKSKNDK